MRGGCLKSSARRSGLRSAAGNPEDVLSAVVVAGAGEDEEEIGKPIEIDDRLRVDRFLLREFQDFDLGTTADGTGMMQPGGGRGTAGKDEAGEWLQAFVDEIDPAFQSGHLFGTHAERGMLRRDG